jgi:hypothetical protein
MQEYTSTKQQLWQEEQQAPLTGMTYQQARDWINNHITDLATAKERMADMAAMMVLLQKQIDDLRKNSE